MGCRPSKQATSKVRAVEHKEDPRCLCSPRKVRKNHKCSDGSSTSSKRVSGGTKSSSKKHSFSSGHKPRAAKSADTDFPAFSTTTAVYRKSASKTSKITLRLSCDGSTLEIEQCDYDLERAYGDTTPKPRPWSSAPNLTRLRDGKARLFRDSYLPMKHSKSAWSPSVTSTASGSRDCKVRVPVFINTTEERMSSKSLANTSSHRSSNASQTGSCSSRQKGSTGKTPLPRTYSKKDSSGSHVAYMCLTDANRSLTFHESQCSPGNQARAGSRASIKECGAGISKTRACGNPTVARSGSVQMTASCTLENMMNDLECSLQISNHSTYSSRWAGGNQPNLLSSLVQAQPNFTTDEITANELKAASTSRYVVETSSDDSFNSENSAEFEQIPVNVISSFIAPASSNTTCCETDSNHNPIEVNSDTHHLSDSREAQWSREGDARECLLLAAHQTNLNQVSCLKNGLRGLQFEMPRCSHPKSTNLFINLSPNIPYSQSEELVSYEPSRLWDKAHQTDGVDTHPNQNSPYIASPIDSNSILTFVTLGCPVSNEMPSFLCTSENDAALSLFTPTHHKIYPYDGVDHSYSGVLINGVVDPPSNSSPRNTCMDTDDDMSSVECPLCRNNYAADDDAHIDNLTQFMIGDSEASIMTHGQAPRSSLGYNRKDATSSRTIYLGPVLEAPRTELPGGKGKLESSLSEGEIPLTETSLVSSSNCLEHGAGNELNSTDIMAVASYGKTHYLHLLSSEPIQSGNFTSASESSHSNETSESSNSESSNSDVTISTIEMQGHSEYHSSQRCAMFSNVCENNSNFSNDYVYCNSKINFEDGDMGDHRLVDAECLMVPPLPFRGSVNKMDCSTSKNNDKRCCVAEVNKDKTQDARGSHRQPWVDEYRGRCGDKQSDSNHSSTSAETIQIIHCESITPHDGYQDDTYRDGSDEKADYLVELLKDDSSQKPAVSHVETRFSYDFDYNREREIDTISVSDASDYEISPLCYKYLGSKESFSSVTRPVKCGALDENDASPTLTNMDSVRLEILHGYLAHLDPQNISQHDLQHESHSIPRLPDDNYVPVACLSPVLEESFSEDEQVRGGKGLPFGNLFLPCAGQSNANAGDKMTGEYLASLVPNELHWSFHVQGEEEDKIRTGLALQLRGDILAKNINEAATHLQVPSGNPLPEGDSTFRMEIKKKHGEDHLHSLSPCCTDDSKLSSSIRTSSSVSLREPPWGSPAPNLTIEREQLHFKESWRSINALISGLGRPLRNSEHHPNRGGIDPRQKAHLNPDNIPGTHVTPLRCLNGGEDMSGCACMSERSSNNCANTDLREDCMRVNAETIPNECAATARTESFSNSVFSCLIESPLSTSNTKCSDNISHGQFRPPNTGLADDGLVSSDESSQPKITSDSPFLSERQKFLRNLCSDGCEMNEPHQIPYTGHESIETHTDMSYLNTICCRRSCDYTSVSVLGQPSKIENIDQNKAVTLKLYPGISPDLKSRPERDLTQVAALESHSETGNERVPVAGVRDDSATNIPSHELTTIGKLQRSKPVDKDIQVNELEAFNSETSSHTSTNMSPPFQKNRPRVSETASSDISICDTSEALGQPIQLQVCQVLEGFCLAYRPNHNNNNNTFSPSQLLLDSSQTSCTMALKHAIDPSAGGPPCCPVFALSDRRPSNDPCASLTTNSATPSSSPPGNRSAGTSSLNNTRLFIDRVDAGSINKPTASNQESPQQNEETERVPRKNVLSLVRYFESVPSAHRETK